MGVDIRGDSAVDSKSMASPAHSPARKPSSIYDNTTEVIVDCKVKEYNRPHSHGIHVADRVEYTMAVTSNTGRKWEVVRLYDEFKNLNHCTENFRHEEHFFPTHVNNSWWLEIFHPATVNEEHVADQLDAWLRDLIGWCSKSEELEFYLHEFLNLEGSAEGDYAPADFKAPAVGYIEPTLVWTGILLSFIGL